MQHTTTTLYFLLISIFLLHSCQSQKSEEWLIDNEASIKADIKNDKFQIINSEFIDNQINTLKTHQKHLNQVNEEKLAASSKAILNDLKKNTQAAITSLEQDSIYHWDASLYNLDVFLKKYDATTSNDLLEINTILAQSDTFYQAAKQNLTAIQIEKGKKAVEENIALYHWLNDELTTSLQSVDLSANDKKRLIANIQNTNLNIKDFIGFVNSLVNNVDDKNNPTAIKNKSMRKGK